jgi:membrane-associated phospholipid phosphatase
VDSSAGAILIYLVYLGVLAWLQPLPPRRRLFVTSVTLLDAAWIWAVSHLPGPAWQVVRDWQPPLQILIGYWLSGAFFRAPMPGVEAWLASGDRRLFDRWGLGALVARGPGVVLELFEAAYLSVYLVLPAGFAVAKMIDPSLDAGRFWTGVVVAELVSYGMLPWIQTRPPRAIGDHMAIDARHLVFRRWNLAVLDRGSIQVNTFPSGHAAGATAIAIVVAAVSPVAGLAFAILAAGIVIGSIAGRYHYALDSLAGILVAVIACALTR